MFKPFFALAAATLIPAAIASAQVTMFTAVLDGAQETPPLAVAGTGTATLSFDASTSRITYSVSVSGLTSPASAAHIHPGAWGLAGPILFGLTMTGPTTWAGTTVALSPAQITTLFTNGYYVNIHTMMHGGGELRGQVLEPAVLTARLGNVNTGPGGPPVDVLRIGGSIGHPTYRYVKRSVGATTLDLVRPPIPGNGLYAVWKKTGDTNGSHLTVATVDDGTGVAETLGTAVFCLPSANTVTPGACPCTGITQGFTSRAIPGAAGAAAVCLHVAPADPRPMVSLPIMLTVGTWTFTGVMFDPNAPTPGPRKVSLTNTVVVVVTP